MNPVLNVQVGANIDQLRAQMTQAQGVLGGFKDQISTVKNVLIGAFSVGAITNLVGSVISVTSEFQKYNAVLTNTLGSSAEAQKSMNDIVKFASQTPFQVNELTDAYVKLTNQGFRPTIDQMTSLGDLASSTGKSFDQLTEAILDAQTGQFERLKEFGIKASKHGEDVTFTFKGVQTTVKNTSDTIKDYILSLGGLEGVTGSMAAISGTLGGKISNLKDSWDQLLLSMGTGSNSIFSNAISLLNGLVVSAKNAIDGLRGGDQTNYFQQAKEDFLAFRKAFSENDLDKAKSSFIQQQGKKVDELRDSLTKLQYQPLGIFDSKFDRKKEIDQYKLQIQAILDSIIATQKYSDSIEKSTASVDTHIKKLKQAKEHVGQLAGKLNLITAATFLSKRLAAKLNLALLILNVELKFEMFL